MNYFISFEGIDGSGKDTQIFELAKAIKEDNNDFYGDKYSNIWLTREPTRITESGNRISDLLRTSKVSLEDATKGFIDDRIEHSEIIRKILPHSDVLTSRYDLSTFAYQKTQGACFGDLYHLHNYDTIDGALIPDFTLVFDLPAKVAFERSRKRNSEKEYFENLAFQEKLVENLHSCIAELRKYDSRKIILINANSPKEKVTQEMIEKLRNYL